MYRIHFEPNGGYFCIQIMFLGFFWRDMKRFDSDKKMETVRFPNLVSARTEANQIGLDKLYQDRSADKYRQHMQQAPAQHQDSYAR